jgi:hypothetical protein
MPHFQIVTTDGVAPGAHELDQHDWLPGSVIYTAPNGPDMRVVRHLDAEDDDAKMHFTVLVVEEV